MAKVLNSDRIVAVKVTSLPSLLPNYSQHKIGIYLVLPFITLYYRLLFTLPTLPRLYHLTGVRRFLWASSGI
jgi:hypothetical protein